MLQNLTTLFQIIKYINLLTTLRHLLPKKNMHTLKEKKQKLTKPTTPKSHELQHSTPNLTAKTLMMNLMTITSNHKKTTSFSTQDITYFQASCKPLFLI
jgi:hypothetical protein